MAVFALPSFSPPSGAPRSIRHRRRLPAVALAAALLAACATGGSDPSPAAADDEAPSTARVDNCGRQVSVPTPPERIFAMNSGSIENLLALGVEDRIIGAVGKPESIREDLRPTVAEVNVIHPGGADYPSSEAVLATEPDLIYSVYPSAFREDGGIASRDELHALGIETYLAPGRCPDRDDEQPLNFDEIWAELRDLGSLLDVQERAEAVVTEQGRAIDAVRTDLPDVQDLDVFWWDMGTDDGPTAGACCGAPGMILRQLGVTNVFDDLPGHWASTSWEQVVERDPDLVVIADLGDDDVDDKLAFITGDPTLRELRAFREGAVVVLPFSQTTPGLQNVTGIETIGAFLADGNHGR